jgi:hypothetical protein
MNSVRFAIDLAKPGLDDPLLFAMNISRQGH